MQFFSSFFFLWAYWPRGYTLNVALTFFLFVLISIVWARRLWISYSQLCLGNSQGFDGARIPGASINIGIRLCHPCHSPGFISRKSGNETAFLPPSGTQTGCETDKEGHSQRWNVIWHCADCYLPLCQNVYLKICFICPWTSHRERVLDFSCS